MNKRYEIGEPRQDAHESLERLLARFEIVPVDRAVATAAADIVHEVATQGTPLHDLHDVYIGATAAVERRSVLTANVDHFERMEDVTVVDWTTY